MLLLGGAYVGARRAMAKDQGRKPRSPLPLWRLLLDEIALMTRRIGRSKVTLVLLAVFAVTLAAETALSPSTLGPFLDQPWRTGVAIGVTMIVLAVWAVVHAVRSTRDEDEIIDLDEATRTPTTKVRRRV